jgi:hypothetical protein
MMRPPDATTALHALLAVLAVLAGATGGVAAADHATVSVENATVAAGETVTLNVTLDRAPVDLRTYAVRASVNDTAVAAVDGAPVDDLPAAARVENATDEGVTVQGIDLATSGEGAIAAGDEDVLLAQVRLRGVSPGTVAVTLSLDSVADADTDPVALAVENATVTVTGSEGPPAVVPGGAAPTDPDGDGLFEDVNGDGRVGVGDVIALFNGLGTPAVDAHVDAYDFSGDGRVGVGDVVGLFDEVTATG